MSKLNGTWLRAGQRNTPSLLSTFAVNDDGYLFDSSEVRARVVKTETNSQIFPALGWEDLTELGRHAKGVYVLYDSDAEDYWLVPADADPGAYYVEWSVRLVDGTTRTWRHDFDVVASTWPSAATVRGLVSPLAVRAEGLSASTWSDDALERMIMLAEATLEEKCGVSFRPHYGEVRLNGMHAEAIFLSEPVLGLEAIYANSSATPLLTSDVAVNFSRTDMASPTRPVPDARRNPWLRFRSELGFYSGAFSSQRRDPRFTGGAHQQRIRGVFGYLDTDGHAPRLVRYAALRLVIRFAKRVRPGSGSVAAGPIKSETTDRHTVSYMSSSWATSVSALVADAEVAEVIQMHRRPIGIGSTAPVFPLPLDGE